MTVMDLHQISLLFFKKNILMKSPQILFVFHLLFLVLYMHTPLGIFLKKSLFRGALREQNIGFAVFECLCF